MRARLFVAATVLALCAPALPARAIPIGPPSISIETSPTGDPFTFDINVHASDPDGVIYGVTVCFDDDGCSFTRYDYFDYAQVTSCVLGTSFNLAFKHTFSTYGSYSVHAVVEAGGCPFLGADESASASATITIPPPVTSSISIPCASAGQPTASDVGVSADKVKIASTVVASGPRASYLAAAAHAMQAVVRAVNNGGGVCGRSIDLSLEDDGGDPGRGQQSVRAFASDNFALAVMPSSDTLAAALASGDIDAAGIPVVGTLGLNSEEFAHPLVWPVGATPMTFAFTSVKHAYDLGARCFGIVHDRTSAEHVATARALREVIATYSDARVCSDVGIDPGRASYSFEIQRWNQECGDGCDGVFIALDPQTALTWMAERPRPSAIETNTVRDLFSEPFAANCGHPCDGFLSWTDTQPPIGEFSSSTKEYVSVMRAFDPAEDLSNHFAESAYLGMLMLLTQLGRTGVDLTRTAFEQTLNSSAFAPGLVGNPLDYSARRDANHWMRAYRIEVAQGAFAGWRDDTGWRSAP